MSKPQDVLPHWDMQTVFPGLESDEFTAVFQSLMQAITDLAALFDAHNINRVEAAPLDDATIATFEAIVRRMNETLETVNTVRSYLFSFLSTDSRNEVAQARFSELQPYFSKLDLLGTRFTAWIGSLEVDSLIARSEMAAAHAYVLHKARLGSLHLMSPSEEALASELGLTGSLSWQHMFTDFTSQLKVTVELDGETQALPLTAAQNLAFRPERDLRERAHQAVLHTLEEASVPLAAALNAIKGETLALCRRRGWETPLDMALFDNALDRPTLDAMMSACQDAFPHFQRYLKARARLMGLPVLAWYDQLVPLGQGSQSYSYADATEFVTRQFASYSPQMAGLAQRAFAENWIDAEPRAGKSGGAFCMSLRDDESRILLNFESSFTSVGTLAHELGHAYHNVALAPRTPLQKYLPMTLAETASTFCQKIVENAALATAVPQDQLIILDGLLEYATRVVLGATSNFLFEQSVFEKRPQRELSAAEFCALEIEAQKATRGDAIHPDHFHPYRWAYVPHYYFATYYNFPYIFGLLFGLGLYAQYQADPAGFQAGYDDLLSSTGLGDAADLAARFGLDIRQKAFWQASLDVLRADVDRFEQLTITN
ncbi:MAG: M3 family oligoendopeptidase [Anaerolineae bacterium]|nr:M3 family oligoendopeptidase [Anaerolineae bacterium]